MERGRSGAVCEATMSLSEPLATRSPSIGREVSIGKTGGYLTAPQAGHGIVVFAHGSGSGRDSPRNQFVARALQKSGLGTLLLDLLTEAEASDRANVFDIELLADRLRQATDWLVQQEPRQEGQTAIGYFGASTGAGAALVAAADAPQPIKAIVSRGGRPDLAGDRLGRVTAPTLLIVGGADTQVLALNRRALEAIPAEKRLSVVPGATHLFEEPGALEQVVDLASRWFETHLTEAGTA
jgi:putative phosphoribosyl transferase